MGTIGNLIVNIGAKIDGLKKGLNDAQNAVNKSANGMRTIMQTAMGFALGGAITAGFKAITSSIGGLASEMINSNAAFEDYQTRFKVLLGSTEAAQQRMDELAEFGATTPFDLPGVVEADLVLQGFGLHSAEAAQKFGFSGEQIRTIAGDVASGTGQDFKEMSLLIGKFSAGATGEAISRFQELGITTRAELTEMGLQFDKAGSLTSPLPEAMTVVLNLMKQKYGGLMDAQSKTFNGMMSNLRDWVGNTIRTIGQPIFEVVKDKLEILLTFLGSPTVQNFVTGFANFLRDGIGRAVEFIEGRISKLVGAFQRFGVRGLAVSILGQLGLSPNQISSVMAVVDQVAGAINKIQGAFERFGVRGAAVSLLGKLGLSPTEISLAMSAIDSIGAGVGWLVDWVQTTAIPTLQGWADWFMTTALPQIQVFASQARQAFWNGVGWLVDWVQTTAIPTLQGWADWFTSIGWPAIQQFASQVLSQLIPGLMQLATWAMQIGQAVLPLLGQAIQFVIDNFHIIGPVLGVVAGLILALSSPVTAIVAAVILLATAWANNWGGIRDKTAAVIEFLKPFWDQLTTLFDKFITLLLPELQKVWQALVTVWQTEVGPALSELWKALQDLFTELGLGTGDTDVWSVALGALKRIMLAVLGAVHSLTPVIHVVAAAIKLGIDQVRTFVEGLTSMKRAAEQILAPLQRMADKLREAIAAALELPEWLIPHSPTPFEMGLRGIGAAMRELPDLNLGVGGQGAGAGDGLALAGAGAGGGGVTIGSITINANSYEGGREAGRGFYEELRSRGLAVAV